MTKEAVGYPLGVSLRPKGVDLVASWETSLLLVAPPGAGKTLRVPRADSPPAPGDVPGDGDEARPVRSVGARPRTRRSGVRPRSGRACPGRRAALLVAGCRLCGLRRRRAARRRARLGGRRGGGSSFGEFLPPFGDDRARRLPAHGRPFRRDDRRRRQLGGAPVGCRAPADPRRACHRSHRLGGTPLPTHVGRGGDDLRRDALGRLGALLLPPRRRVVALCGFCRQLLRLRRALFVLRRRSTPSERTAAVLRSAAVL